MSIGIKTNSQPVFKEENIWNLKYISGLQLHPGGQWALYLQKEYNLNENLGQTDIYLINLQINSTINLTQSVGSESNAAFWGNKVVFLALDDHKVNQIYSVSLDGSEKTQLSQVDNGINEFKMSPDGNYLAFSSDVTIESTNANLYKDLPKATGKIYDGLMMRHWNQWEDMTFSHLFISNLSNGMFLTTKDVMPGEQWDFPVAPMDGFENLDWHPNSQMLTYACKKLTGTEYAKSTNSNVFLYDIRTEKTKNLTPNFKGYDKEPRFSPDGKRIIWLSMERDGYEADKNRLMMANINVTENDVFISEQAGDLTKGFDYNAHTPLWAPNGRRIYFTAEINGTIQIYFIDLNGSYSDLSIKPLTQGLQNFNSISVASTSYKKGKKIIHKDIVFGTSTTMFRPNEIFSIDPVKGTQKQISNANGDYLSQFATPILEQRMVTTTDGKQMLSWVIKPPDFDSTKKYPAVLLCQGGPQSMVGQGFSTRWNMRVFGNKGYLIIYPCRRGMPGFGQEWNEQISGDWGGQAMKDLLSASDDVANEPWCDKDNMGCVGASFGGYSVYWLAGNHQNRFKTFIAHCGIFNTTSMYGSTEEIFFENFDKKGPYWENPDNPSYTKFSPHNFVKNWDAPIMVIHNEKDFRVPLAEGLQAFSAAQLNNIKSRFFYFPDEGHWVTKPQNSVLWNRVFFDWLDQSLKN